METRTDYSKKELKQLGKNDLCSLVLQMQEALQEKDDRIDVLTERLRLSQVNSYGRKSELTDQEAIANGQLSFDSILNEAEAIDEEYSREEETPSEEEEHTVVKEHTRRKGKRAEDLSKMKIYDKHYELSKEELAERFPEGCYELKPEITYTVEHIPAETFAIKHITHKYRSNKDSQSFADGGRPKKLFHGSLASPSLVAGVMNAKYVNAMPLYRLEQEFLRNGVPIDRGEMAHWMILSADRYLYLLYDRMKQILRLGHVVQADETPVLVNKDDRKAGSKSYMWVYRTGLYSATPIVIFEYQKTRHSDHPKEFLKDFNGVLVTDGYAAYQTLVKSRNGEIKLACCWVHANRKFKDALKTMGKSGKGGTAESIAEEAVRRIGAITHEDNQLEGLTSEERLQIRQEKIKPLVDDFFAWLKECRNDVTKKSLAGRAISYCLDLESYLKTFLEDGEVAMDNNGSERAIRPVCIGKKNWVMSDTIRGADASAIIYSITETAKANGLNPYAYLRHVLTEMCNHSDDTDLTFLDDLLPWSPTLPESCKVGYLPKHVKEEI